MPYCCSSQPPATPEQIALWKQQLAEAQARRHKLKMGSAAIELQTQGDMVKFARTNVNDLDAYIAELQALIAGVPTSGAVGFAF